MKTILIIWLLLFVITLALIVLFSKKAFKQLINADNEKKQWKLMGGRFGFYEFTIIFSFIISGGLAYLIQYVFVL